MNIKLWNKVGQSVGTVTIDDNESRPLIVLHTLTDKVYVYNMLYSVYTEVDVKKVTFII